MYECLLVRFCFLEMSDPFIFYAIIVCAFLLSFEERVGRKLNSNWSLGNLKRARLTSLGIPVIPLEIRVISRAGSLRSRRMDRWPPVPARTNDRLVLDTGSISWFICGTQGCHLLSRVEPKSVFPPSRKRTETRSGEGGGRGSVQGLLENLYTEREGVVYTAKGRVDLIRWWFFNETSCARHTSETGRDLRRPILRGAKGRRNARRADAAW